MSDWYQWYRVIKRCGRADRRYVYLQSTRRNNGHTETRNQYLGVHDGGEVKRRGSGGLGSLKGRTGTSRGKTFAGPAVGSDAVRGLSEEDAFAKWLEECGVDTNVRRQVTGEFAGPTWIPGDVDVTKVTLSDGHRQIEKEGGFAKMQSLVAVNAYAAEQLGGSLNLNPHYLYARAMALRWDLRAWLHKLDAETDPAKRLEIGFELLDKLKERGGSDGEEPMAREYYSDAEERGVSRLGVRETLGDVAKEAREDRFSIEQLLELDGRVEAGLWLGDVPDELDRICRGAESRFVVEELTRLKTALIAAPKRPRDDNFFDQVDVVIRSGAEAGRSVVLKEQDGLYSLDAIFAAKLLGAYYDQSEGGYILGTEKVEAFELALRATMREELKRTPSYQTDEEKRAWRKQVKEMKAKKREAQVQADMALPRPSSKAKVDGAQLRQELARFGGTDQWYRSINYGVTYTDGVKHFADTAGAHWLLDIVATELPREVRRHVTVKVKAKSDGHQAKLVARCDDRPEPLWTKEIEITDLPEGEWDLLMHLDGPQGTIALILPGEL